MKPTMAAAYGVLSIISVLLHLSSLARAVYNVVDYGARPDGVSDSSSPFLRAWADACAATGPADIVVPRGRYFVRRAAFQGPCNSSAINIYVNGSIVASEGYDNSTAWLWFRNVDGVSVVGGVIDGRGASFWACKAAGGSCPKGAMSLMITNSKNLLVEKLTSINSKLCHIVVLDSNNVTIRMVNIFAPGNSPHTDGIRVRTSEGVTITRAKIQTGDDCIALGRGSKHVWMERVSCGPGHGISIGSLANTLHEQGVVNVTLKVAAFDGAQNGFRIKSWARPSTGFVTGVHISHATMSKVQFPIVIDQNYCPYRRNCPNSTSGIKISDVKVADIRGTSAGPVAVKFDCSASAPCTGINMKDIKLTYEQNQTAQSLCNYAYGTASGTIDPPSCLLL